MLVVVFGAVIAEVYKSKSINGYEAWFLSGTVVAVVAFGAMLMTIQLSHARDPDGRYAGTPLHDWFEGLRAGAGPCCSDSDGNVVLDGDWESKDGHYRVRLRGYWIDVPDDRVITTPNLFGRTVVWPASSVYGIQTVRCFMPGAMM